MSQLKIKNGNNWESIPAGGIGVPSGGNAGDVLVKSSSTDYATGWSDIREITTANINNITMPNVGTFSCYFAKQGNVVQATIVMHCSAGSIISTDITTTADAVIPSGFIPQVTAYCSATRTDGRYSRGYNTGIVHFRSDGEISYAPTTDNYVSGVDIAATVCYIAA